jgi:hypothetical protein
MAIAVLDKIKKFKKRSIESGSILILSLIIIFAMTAIGLSVAQTVATQYTSNKQQLNVENAIGAAEAGVSATLAQTTPTGYASEQTLYSDAQRGKATYTVGVSTDSNGNKILTSTGKVYRLTTDTLPTNTKVIRVVAAIKNEKITNSLIFGSGNLYLSQGAGFPYGDVYIRGQLSMEQNAAIGSNTQSANVNIANMSCGNSSNWPQVCGASNPPIKMLNATPGSIYGTVCATNQTSSTGIYPGPSGSGLVAGCSPRVSAAPSFNKKAFTQSVSATGTDPSVFQCSFFTSTITIPAGTRINGDLSISAFFGPCTVYIAGDVYITGNLTINPGVVVRVADSAGTVKPTVVVNKGLGFFVNGGNNDVFLPNSSGTPLFLIIFWSTNMTCSTDPNIPSDTVSTCLSPSEAQASAAYSQFSGSPATVNATGVILYAYYTSFSMSNDVAAQFYGFGAQGGWLGPRSQITTTATDAPFGSILAYPTYRIVDYQQIY